MLIIVMIADKGLLFHVFCSITYLNNKQMHFFYSFSFLIEILDGREISETSKKFLYNWSVSKDAMKRRQRKNMKSVPSMNHFREGILEKGIQSIALGFLKSKNIL